LSEDLGTAVLQLKTDDAGLRKGLSKAERPSKKSFVSIGKGAIGAVGGFLLLGKAVKDVVGDWAADEKAAAQTAAAIKSTGGAANVTAKQVTDLSTALRDKTGIDDSVIQSGANMLLTFTNVRNEVGKGNDIFTQATKTLLDMSTALGTAPSKSAIQLGKALNDPIKGITALRRVGVTFTDGQKKVIEAMVKSGNVMGAQKLILKELQKEFGGSAVAAGQTLGGQLNILRGQLEDAAGVIITKLQPYLARFVAWCIENWPRAREAIENAIQTIVDSYDTDIKPWVDAIVAIFEFLVGQVRAHWDEISAIVEAATDQIKAIIDIFAGALSGDWERMWKGIKAYLSATLDQMRAVLTLAVSLLGAAAKAIGAAILAKVKEGVGNLVEWVGTKLGEVPGAIRGALAAVGTAAIAVGAKILSGLKDGASELLEGTKTLMGKVSSGISSAAGAVLSAATTIGGKILSGIKAGVGDLATWVKGIVTGAIQGVLGIFNSLSVPRFAVGFDTPGFKVGPVDVGSKHIGFDIGGWAMPDLHLPGFADGAIVNRATAGIFGEAGPEMILPLTNPDRSRQLLEQAGMAGNQLTQNFYQTPANADPVAIGAVTSFALKTMRV
jgi:hypothetical protein